METTSTYTTLVTALAQEGGPRLASDSPLPGMLMAAGVLMLFMVTWVSLRKKYRARAEHVKVTPQKIRLQAEQRARGRIESVMVDAEELARRLAAHLDNKAARLEILLQEADERIAELKESVDCETVVDRSHAFDASGVKDPRSKRILDMASTGRTAMDISRELDEPIGTVELVLALRAKQPAVARGVRG